MGVAPIPIVNRRLVPARWCKSSNSFLFVADLAVGKEDDLLEPGTVLRALKGLSQGRKHFGPAIGGKLFRVPNSLFDRGGGDRLQRGEE